MLETNRPVKPFLGVRFVLVGFDSVEDSKIRYKLIDGGAVDSGQYNPSCTHVIVNKTVNDDPVCVAARKDCKTVVTGLWVDHSYDIGMPVDFTSVMYRPPKDLNGIPGAKGLVMCLTGYQRQDRDDIMTLVGLMGAQFSKPLVANKVTHLICYKFEGEKYELGKKLSKIKLVNHRWLEDCLKEWEILPEANYSKSGYELEVMEAEAKDSEEEAEDTSLKPLAEMTVPKSPCNLEPSIPQACNSPNVGVSNSKAKLTDFRSEGTSVLDNIPVTKAFEYNSVDDVAQHQYQSPFRKNAANNLTPSSRRTERPPHSDVKSGSVSYTRKMLRNLGDLSGNHSGFDKDAMKAKDLSSSLAKQDQAKDAGGSKSYESPKKSNLLSGERPVVYLPQNCMQTNSYGTPNLKKTGSEVRPCIRKSLSPNDKVLGLGSSFFDRLGDTDIIEAEVADKETVSGADPRLEYMEHANRGEKSTPSSPKRMKTSLSGSAEFGDFDAGNSSLHQQADVGTAERKSDHERDKPSSLNPKRNEEPTTITKSFKKKTAAKKTLGSRPKIASKAKEKESMRLNKRDSTQDETVGWSWGQGNEKSEKAADSALCEVPKVTETTGGLKCEDSAIRRTVTAPDDETESPEDRDEHALDKAAEEIEAASLFNGVTANTCDVAPEPEIKGNVSENVDDTNVSAPSGSKSKGKGLKRKNAKEKATTSRKKKAKKVVDTMEEFKSNKECVDAEVTRNEADGATNEMENTKKDVKRPAAKSRASQKMLEKSVEEEKENAPVNRGAEKKTEDKRNSQKQAKTRSDIKKSSETSDALKSSGKMGSVVAKRDLEKQDKTRSDIKKSSEKSNNPKFSGKMTSVVDIARSEPEPVLFILTGHRFQRREFQKIIRRLRGRVCRDTHQWSYQATHFIVPEPIRRTEKFFAAAASGRWILKTDYLTASSEAGKFQKEEDYEWHENGLNDDGAINLVAPRKWRLLRQRTGHGAFYGMRIIIYGDCIAPSLDTLKRVVKAGDGTIVATSPPYTRFLNCGVDFAVVSPGMPRVDAWVQEFLKHELPCIAADYLVEYVCKPGSSLERHILYDTNSWAHKSSARLEALSEEMVRSDVVEEDDVPCGVCGSHDRGEVMLICGDEGGARGCGIGCHIDCCDPPMEAVPQDDWFCSDCSKTSATTKKKN